MSWIWLYQSEWQVSLVRQRTHTPPEHVVLPFLQCALKFERSICYIVFTDFGTSMDYPFWQRMGICSYWCLLWSSLWAAEIAAQQRIAVGITPYLYQLSESFSSWLETMFYLIRVDHSNSMNRFCYPFCICHFQYLGELHLTKSINMGKVYSQTDKHI